MWKSLAIFLALSVPLFAQGRVVPELCGQWTYYSGGSTYTGGGYSSQRYVILHPNGTYEYSGESSNSGGHGQAYGSDHDRGQWWIQGETLCARSAVTGQTSQYTIELRNHPKTGDPMIVIDGDAYVTATQRPPWPDF